MLCFQLNVVKFLDVNNLLTLLYSPFNLILTLTKLQEFILL